MAGLMNGGIMESSRRHIIQAEIDYWHEMLLVNRDVLSQDKEVEMRNLLKKAIRQLNQQSSQDHRVAA